MLVKCSAWANTEAGSWEVNSGLTVCVTRTLSSDLIHELMSLRVYYHGKLVLVAQARALVESSHSSAGCRACYPMCESQYRLKAHLFHRVI